MVLDEARRDLACDKQLEKCRFNYATVVRRVADRLGLTLTTREADDVLYYLESDQEGFGILQGLLSDPDISDIIISDYKTVVVQRGRKNAPAGIEFSCQEDYEAFVERILLRAGTTYSTRQPIADGMIESLARVHAVHKSICGRGPYLTIRINRFSSVQSRTLSDAGMAPSLLLGVLEQYVRTGMTLLLVGEVGTGKTTLARALASSIPQDESVLVIEDTPEIRLDHPYVRYLQTREVNCEGEGRVTPRQCIRAGMRMAMNRIVYGEIRDSEAAEGFIDCCASGHPGLSTIHARGAVDCVTRLMLFLGRAQPGVGREVLMQQVSTAVQVIVHIGVCPLTKLRRVLHVRELCGVADGVLRHRDMFTYHVEQGRGVWKVNSRTSSYLSGPSEDASDTRVSLHALPLVIGA
jgi:pilus assembly protein CpaF